jgi:hypothetical protein
MNFHSIQNPIEIWGKYLETSKNFEAFSGDRLEHLEQLWYSTPLTKGQRILNKNCNSDLRLEFRRNLVELLEFDSNS